MMVTYSSPRMFVSMRSYRYVCPLACGYGKFGISLETANAIIPFHLGSIEQGTVRGKRRAVNAMRMKV